MASLTSSGHVTRSRRPRRAQPLVETLKAYAFLLPAGIIIFLFGIFPVAFALFVSLHEWRRFPDAYVGLDNYTRALGGFGNVFFFWLAVAALGVSIALVWRLWREHASIRSHLAVLVAGIVNGVAALLFLRWFFLLLPVVLEIPQRVRGQERVPGLFVNELVASFATPPVAEAGNVMLLALAVGLGVSLAIPRLHAAASSLLVVRWTGVALLAGLGLAGLQFAVSETTGAIAAAQAVGEALPIWSQILLISLGTALMLAAYLLWTRALKQDSDRRFGGMIVAAIALLAAGYLLVAELPPALAAADDELLQSFVVTVLFVIGTVPFQLAIGLILAYLLFQDIRGRSFFRIVYFLPYITPFVATSVVFKLIFSHRSTSVANQLVTSLGLPVQNWLLERKGIVELIFGEQVPDVLAGPSLALIVIMMYTVWTYIGYDTAIFLAGLTTISGELYEAARIDGASAWGLFRHITLPLLSPTTFFLSLIAIIGTFQAFTQIWIMRTPAAAPSVDTVSVYIFETVRTANPNMGYGSAMAFVLFIVILLLTFAQNRFAERRVFYG